LGLWPANSLFVEGYLTTRGDSVTQTYRMIREAGFEIDGNPMYEEERAAPAFKIPGGSDELLKPDIKRTTPASA